jgi:hypothetical protein
MVRGLVAGRDDVHDRDLGEAVLRGTQIGEGRLLPCLAQRDGPRITLARIGMATDL